MELKPEELRALYASVKRNYDRSSDARELNYLLQPLARDISRIVAIGVGIPSKCSRSAHKPLQQIAMLEKMQTVINEAKSKSNRIVATAVYYSDFNVSKKVDKDFIQNDRNFELVPWNPAIEYDHPPEPQFFEIKHKRKRYWVSACSGLMRGVGSKIDAATLVFMPNLVHRPILRVMAENDPIMVIGNPIDGLCKWDCTTGMAIVRELLDFQDRWAEETAGYRKLRDKYWRKRIGLGFMAYELKSRIGFRERRGWSNGEDGIDVDAIREELTTLNLEEQKQYDVVKGTLKEYLKWLDEQDEQ